MGVTLPYTYLQDLEAEIMQSMEACLARVTAVGLDGDIVVVHGVPFHEIVETAKTQKVDLIVMGTHGRTGLQHVLLGSVPKSRAPGPMSGTHSTSAYHRASVVRGESSPAPCLAPKSTRRLPILARCLVPQYDNIPVAYIERGGTQGLANADTVVSEDSDAVFPLRVCAWRCVADYARVETPGHFWRAATCLLASAHGRLAHAVYFWRGVLDVSVFERSTATQRDLGWFTYGALNLGLLLRAVVEPWHSLSPGRCRLAPGTVSGAPGSSRLGLRYQYLGPHPGPSALNMPTLSRCFLRGGLLCLAIGMIPGGLILLQKGRLVPNTLGVAPSSYLFGTDRWAEPMHFGRVLLDLPAL